MFLKAKSIKLKAVARGVDLQLLLRIMGPTSMEDVCSFNIQDYDSFL